MNNVDLAIRNVRKLQQMILDPKLSQMDLFNFTNTIIGDMERASAEINTNYAEISRKLTEQMNTGKVQE